MADQFENGRRRRRTGTKRQGRINLQDTSYEVGYGKPPKEHQFKPGQSGNPKGRPKHKTELESQRDMRAILMQAAMTPVTTTIDGRRTKIPALEAVYLKMFAKAIEGDGPSMRFAHKLANETMAEHEEWQALFYERALAILDVLQNQPAKEKDPEAISLIHELMRRIDAKPTDKS